MHRCVTFIILCCSNVHVFNVPLKSAKIHTSDTDSAKNIEHVAVSGEHSQNHVYNGVRHKRHPFPIFLTVYAHAQQKRAWPHGTNAMPSRETNRQTSHISVADDVAQVADVDVDVETSTLPTPHLCTGDCQFYILSVILDIYRSQAYVHCGIELVSVTRSSMWNLYLHWSYIFQSCNLQSRIFRSRILTTPSC